MKRELSFTISEKKRISTELPAFIAGIINVTPDSFCPVGRCSAEIAAETALKIISDGADLIDIGAESTRPGHTPVSEEEELNRLIPAVRAIRKVTDCPLSIDTTKASVMKAALDEGADILNDVSALQNDKMMENVCVNAEIPVILMHNHDIIQREDEDTAVLVSDFLTERVLKAIQAGIDPERIILDAGVGFGKTLQQNICCIKESSGIRERVIEKTGIRGENIFPVMMALSRKSCIGMITGREVEKRLSGTVSANLLAVQGGAVFLRVHDVAETRDMLSVMNALQKGVLG